MPKVMVGGKMKHFPYTKAGKRAAKAAMHHSGKGTRSRLNTAAEKHMFNSKVSK